MRRKHIIFLVNLLQDVNIIRPLAFLAARELDIGLVFMVSHRFLQRDTTRLWQREIALLCGQVGGEVHIYGNEADALRILAGKSGMIIAASESNLSGHADTHNVFRLAPADFLKVTMQHGFECVGFLHNRDHNRAHGHSVTFAADVLCGWFDGGLMTSMPPSQRPKLYVSGPPAVLQIPAHTRKAKGGLVCENLHSVRLNTSGDFKASFIDIFDRFCAVKGRMGETVFLRPHPGGQYVIKNNVALASNVELVNKPIYRVDLHAYEFGISAPSSVVIDMLLANIPVGLWSDEDDVMDTGNYAGLHRISTLDEWLSFSTISGKEREAILKRQTQFLDRMKMPIDPAEVRSRFLRLLAAGSVNLGSTVNTPQRCRRILFVANGLTPTLQISFLKPLKALIDSGIVAVDFLLEDSWLSATMRTPDPAMILRRMQAFDPDMIVLTRYSGGGAEDIVRIAKDRNCPVIYHIDDDLLNVPLELGTKKFKAHNHPRRVGAVKYLLQNSDLVYCSTPVLEERLRKQGFTSAMRAGRVNCSGSVLSPPRSGRMKTIGYMGFDHAHDLELVLPPLIKFLRKRKTVRFELFGSIPKPAALDEFGDRVTVIEPVRDYEVFLKRFNEVGWDVGICPLQFTRFNETKANNKWVEYTSIGTAVVATKNMLYNDCCADGCGILAASDNEWFEALDQLYRDSDYRMNMVRKAQRKLEAEFSDVALRQQIFDVFAEAQQNRKLAESDGEVKNTDMTIAITKEPRERILVVADTIAATQQISFQRPFKSWIAKEDVTLDMAADGPDIRSPEGCAALFDKVRPSVLFLSRFAEAYQTPLIDLARAQNIAVIFQIDDDLLNVPENLGPIKYEFYNNPARKAALRRTIGMCDLLYTSTRKLREVFKRHGIRIPIREVDAFSTMSTDEIKPYKPAEKPVIGYMGTLGHAADLAMVMPVIHRLMAEFPEMRFETFGSVKATDALLAYGPRYKRQRVEADYNAFLDRMHTIGWWAGIAPLENHIFNLCKTDTKWVEYSASGVASVTSDLPVYERACGGGGGLMASDLDQWYEHLRHLIVNEEARRLQVEIAQERLRNLYRPELLVYQTFDIINTARTARGLAS